MKREFRKGDIIAEIGNPYLWVVVSCIPNATYYGLEQIDVHGNDMMNFFGVDKRTCHENYIKVGKWPNGRELPNGFDRASEEMWPMVEEEKLNEK